MLAYSDPSESPVSYLLSERNREELADQVNAVILSTVQKYMDGFVD